MKLRGFHTWEVKSPGQWYLVTQQMTALWSTAEIMSLPLPGNRNSTQQTPWPHLTSCNSQQTGSESGSWAVLISLGSCMAENIYCLYIWKTCTHGGQPGLLCSSVLCAFSFRMPQALPYCVLAQTVKEKSLLAWFRPPPWPHEVFSSSAWIPLKWRFCKFTQMWLGVDSVSTPAHRFYFHGERWLGNTT